MAQEITTTNRTEGKYGSFLKNLINGRHKQKCMA